MNFEIVHFDKPDENHILHENLSQRCGEVFMTTEWNLIFHCTLCEKDYKGFAEYECHLNQHFPGPEADCITEIELKNKNLSDIDIPLGNSCLEDTNILEFSGSCGNNFGGTEADIKERTIVNDNEFTIKKIKAENMDSIDETNECRPVRRKTNYLKKSDEVRKYKCDICPASFKDKSSLRKHTERHTTQKVHQCPQCQKMFYTPFDVKKHLKIHTGERPFLCTVCGRTCLSGSKLKDHMRRHTNQRDYKCSHCEKEFYNASLLTEHLQAHTNERRHKCSVCNANFTYKKGLRNHMKLHENKRNYKCELCSASFNQQAGLFSHMKNKHKTI